MLNTRSRRALVGALLGGLLAIATMAPASAHRRTITDVYGSDFEEGGTHAAAWLGPNETHAGIMRITLKMRVDGAWVFVDRARAYYQVGWGYHHTFDPIPTAERCKAFAKFTSNDHPDLSKQSDPFDC